ncbi:MAG: LamG-like jellyroll fold domain-containing protein, partial [Gemmatimonadales bacterium]
MTTQSAPIAITVGARPVPVITQPPAGTVYRAGDTINFAGTATDAESGTLGAAAFRWQVILRHLEHGHPFVGPLTGVTSGSFTIPSTGHGPENTSYEIQLTVTDPDGLTGTAVRSIQPVVAPIALDTTPSGIPLFLDGDPLTTPRQYQSLSGFVHTVEAPAAFTLGGSSYVFDRWGDGAARIRSLIVPESGTSATALYNAAGPRAATRSVRFYGTGGGTAVDRIRIQQEPPAPVDVGAGDFTVEFWMRGTRAANVTPLSGYRPIGQQENATDDWINGNVVVDRDLFGTTPTWGASVHRDGTRAVLRFGTADGSNFHTLQGVTEVLDGVWHHVALVRERVSGRKRIVVDGALDVESAAGASTGDLSYPDGRATALPQSDPFLVFGAEKHGAPGNSEFPSFAGWLDEIRAWSVARSVAEIAATRDLAVPPNTSGLVLYLPLEEGVGQALTDTTGGDTATLYVGVMGNGEWSIDT